MAPSPLHGLNIVHSPNTNDSHLRRQQSGASYLSDRQDLLAGPPFPDLAAQLDLWTNLTFHADEPLLKDSSHDKQRSSSSADSIDIDDDEEPEHQEGTANPDAHENVVSPTNTTTIGHAAPQQRQHQQQAPYDVNSILAGFGIDPFLVPPVSAPQQNQAASLAQILSAYPFAASPPGLFAQQVPPFAIAQPIPSQTSSESDPAPSSKRSRARKASTSASNAPITNTSSPEAMASPSLSPSTSMAPVEDKRRRNTAASARFRLKKKEREAALEKRAKELEGRVGELERECESLRRENGWLKGLVVGVTSSGGNVTAAGVGSTGNGGTSSAGVVMGKRKRDEQEAPNVVASA